jgi:hypothetical protein
LFVSYDEDGLLRNDKSGDNCGDNRGVDGLLRNDKGDDNRGNNLAYGKVIQTQKLILQQLNFPYPILHRLLCRSSLSNVQPLKLTEQAGLSITMQTKKQKKLSHTIGRTSLPNLLIFYQIFGKTACIPGRMKRVSGAMKRVSGAMKRVSGTMKRVSWAMKRVSGAMECASGAMKRVSGAMERLSSAMKSAPLAMDRTSF